MVSSASLFRQLLQHFPRLEFAALVREHRAERSAKGFTCWMKEATGTPPEITAPKHFQLDLSGLGRLVS